MVSSNKAVESLTGSGKGLTDLQPSLSQIVHHLPKWQMCKSKIASRFFRRESESRDVERANEGAILGESKPKQYEYLELDSFARVSRGDQEDLTPLKSVRTFVYTGTDKPVENDGIHLQQKVEQVSI